MASRRTLILMGTLLALLAGYFLMQLIPTEMSGQPDKRPPALRPLGGENSISGLELKQAASGLWAAEFNYYYTGAPSDALFVVELDGPASQYNEFTALDTFAGHPLRGTHHLRVNISYPGAQGRTVRVRAVMVSRMDKSSATRQELDAVIDWPDPRTWAVGEIVATRSPAYVLEQVQAVIDTDGDMQVAKRMLEKLLEQNPNFGPAYIELARIEIKTNWGPAGLHQAEAMLTTALQIRPDSSNAKILLGQVYAFQGRFAKAEALFRQVAKSGTNNLWLWANWGRLFELERRTDQAIIEYRTAIAHPMTHDRNDRARVYAYEHLLALLGKRKDFDAMQVLYKQQISEFGWGSCYSAGYTRLLLQVRGDVEGAIASARRALNQSCDDSPSRELLGLAEYVKWAASTDSSREEALNQARIFLPVSARALYLLASSDKTVGAARRLTAAGEPIDQKDNENLDALAYALQERDFDAVRRLMALGARAKTPVGEAEIPVALLPVISGDITGVGAMRQLGVDYSKLRYRGATALDFAKRQGNEALLTALGSEHASL